MSEDRQGIDRLRAAIERVATEIEDRPSGVPARPAGLGMRLALGTAAAVLIALLIGSWLWIAPSDGAEVEVLLLKVHGREVRARILDDTAPETIIVIPQPGNNPPAATAAPLAIVGGAR